MLKHILTASPGELFDEAERISLLDEPDREEAILELLHELQEQAELLAYKEGEDDESSYDEDSWDPDTYEREDDSMELVDDFPSY